MSNPGVITLAEKKLTGGRSIRIEDNIGEAIHIHYEDIRIDLTVEEFKQVVRTAEESLQQLLETKNFCVKDYDPVFLDMMSEQLLDLIEVKDDVICLEDIKIVRKGFLGLPVVRGLKESHVYRALQGDAEEHEQYQQENRWGENNRQRLSRMMESIKENGYSAQGQYMVFYNDQNNIRDGQHRAACLYFLNGNMEVPIRRFIFKDNKYNVSGHPWVQVLFSWNGRRVKRCIRALLRKGKHFIRRVFNKIFRMIGIR